MLNIRRVTAALAVCLPLTALGQDACRALENLIDSEVRVVAYRSLSLISSGNEMANQVRANGAWLAINAYVSLMAQHKCPALKVPPNPQEYSKAAGECGIALMRGQPSQAQCDLSSWAKGVAK